MINRKGTESYMNTNWNASNPQTRYFDIGSDFHISFSFNDGSSSRDWAGRETGIRHVFCWIPRPIFNPLDYELSQFPTRTIGVRWGNWSFMVSYCISRKTKRAA